jgi:beta-1,4-mannosyl-glycoprotein beta-1,4-N-acetylglucosaminyltransferase
MDLLEIRLEMLYDVVDYFVISETTQTHSGIPKPSYFLQNKHMYEKYMDKIIHVLNDYPKDILKIEKRPEDSDFNIKMNEISFFFDKEENEGQLKQYPTWCRDYLQREFSKLGLLNCEDDDIILVSDLDEIPNPETIKMIREKEKVNCVLLHNCHYYYVNLIAHTNWCGAFVIRYKDTKNSSFTHIRGRSGEKLEKIPEAGWHFSFMGGIERIKIKIQSYAHQEFNNPNVFMGLEWRVNNKKDLFGRTNNTYINSNQEFYYDDMKQVNMDFFPEKLRKLIETKFEYLIKK